MTPVRNLRRIERDCFALSMLAASPLTAVPRRLACPRRPIRRGLFVKFEELLTTVREWQRTMTPEEARARTEEWARGATVTLGGLLVPASIDVEAVLAFAISGRPFEPQDDGRFLRWSKPRPPRRRRRRRAPKPPPVIDVVSSAPARVAAPEPLQSEPPAPVNSPAGNGRLPAKERAEAFVREQLANGPRYGELVKRDAAEYGVSERFLIAAAERLNVRSWRGLWRLPG
jgi:hypothetical protein